MTATPVISASAHGRLETLDGMRGVAALSVVFFHFFVRWAEPQFSPTLYAHGDVLSRFPFTLLGSFGVFLFFLISGFVIMMTLERAKGLADFTVRRAARLWPAMLFCATASTLLINWSGVATTYENVTRWHVTPVEYWSSIFFIPPDLTADIFGITQADRPRWVEGVYWTLWAEVRFYALIALAFWLSPRAAFVWVWAGLQLASTVLDIAGNMGAGIPTLAHLALQPDMLAWFTFGLVAWKWRTGGASLPLVIALTSAALALAVGPIIDLRAGVSLNPGAPWALALNVMVAVPFILFLAGSHILAPLRWRPLVAIGLASYPLYLFHERTGLIYLDWLNSAGLNPWISVAITFAVVIAIAVAIHKFIEMPGKRLMTRSLIGGAGALERRFPALKFG